MTLKKAMGMFVKKYEEALTLPGIRNPVAWALYQTWKEADKDAQKQDQEDK